MRIALISDIHGNLAAMDQVMDDITRLSIDKSIFLGDLLTLGRTARRLWLLD